MKKTVAVLALTLALAFPAGVMAANTGNTNAMDGQTGAKVSGAPLSHALGGRGMLFGNTKADFIPPVGWAGEATVEDPAIVEKCAPGLKGVKKGDVIKIEKLGPKKYKLTKPGTGASTVITVK